MSNQVTICNSSNQILAGLLSGNAQARPNIMYVEFKQGLAAVNELPNVDPADNDYYRNLRENNLSDRDFLRIPIVAVNKQGSEGEDITLLFNGICVGDKGVGGKLTRNSMIYGIALANSPTYGTTTDDITRDIVWARGYFDVKNQMPFSNVSQTLVTFKLNLTN